MTLWISSGSFVIGIFLEGLRSSVIKKDTCSLQQSPKVFSKMNNSLTPNTYKWEVVEDGKLLLDRHLNFDVRYTCVERIITHKDYLFHDLQIRPSVGKCRDGRCDEALCHIPDEGFVSAEDYFTGENQNADDPVIGKLVEISLHGFVSFKDADGDNRRLDLNWKRLRNMAQPIVDEQLAHLALMGNWENKPIKVNLGTMMLDNQTIRFDPHSYHEMEKDNKKDLVQCQAAWLKKLRVELHNRGIHKQDDGSYKRRKTVTNLHDAGGDKANMEAMNGNGLNDEPFKNGSVYQIKREIKREEDNGKENAVNEEVVKNDVACKHCGGDVCVWFEKKGIMEAFDENEHGHLPDDDKPPNNIRRKKLYRQMFLFINQGPAGAGVRMELPKCVEDGARQMFPSPSFMGFKSM
jgi:hypothetical protein